MIIDTESNTVTIEDPNGDSREISLYSKESFDLISKIWMKIGWNEKYPYCFSWLGRPIIQNPEDIIRYQEIVYRIKPEIIIETGVAHGGSLVLSASLLKLMGIPGKVIGVDIEIRKHNRNAVEKHELSDSINLIEGDSIDVKTVEKVKSMIEPGQKVMIVLDSCHTKSHVLKELEAYHDLVSLESYIVATDGSMKDLHDVPRGSSEWITDNPSAAAKEFITKHPNFIIEQPRWPFNESNLDKNITHWPDAWLKRIS